MVVVEINIHAFRRVGGFHVMRVKLLLLARDKLDKIAKGCAGYFCTANIIIKSFHSG